MTCQEVVLNLPAFEDGDLPPAVLSAVRQHLDACEACIGELAAMDAAWAMLDQVPAPTVEVAQDFNHRFWKRVEAEPVGLWQRLRQGMTHLVRMPVRAMAVLSVMLVLMAGMFSTIRTPEPPTMPIPLPAEQSQYDVFGDVAPDPSELDAPAAPAEHQAKAPSSDEKVDQILQDMPLESGPQG